MIVVQIINFNLKNMEANEYEAVCENLAESFAIVPGLLAKYWLSDSANNTFGGVYIWEDRAAIEDFSKSKLYKAVATHPNLINITSEVFDILENPTKLTRGLKIVDLLKQQEAIRHLLK